jgi:hypothetical protein
VHRTFSPSRSYILTLATPKINLQPPFPSPPFHNRLTAMPKRDPSPTPLEESPVPKEQETILEANSPALAITETYEARLARLTQELAELIERVQREKAGKDAKTLTDIQSSRKDRSPNR